MRLFIAVELPKEIKDKLYDFQKKLKPFVKASFIHKKNIHLTLKFIGECEKEDLKKIKDSLENISLKKFKITLDKFGVFPDYGFMKIIWIGLQPEDKINQLQTKVDEETLSFGKKESTFKAHLTLARVKNVKNKEKLIDILKESKLDGEFEVSEFKLMKSELSKDGPSYEVLETYSLG